MKEKMTVSYSRLSEEDLEKMKDYSASIYNQLSLIKGYAKRMGLTIDKEYIDDGYSGINFDRPGFEELKSDVEKGKVGIVITKDMSRLGREFVDTVYYISEFFPRYNVRYIAINDKYDSDNPDDSQSDFLLKVRAVINDRHVKETSIKRKQVAFSKTNNGEFIGFVAPYGYKIVKKEDKRTLEIDEEAAKVVRRIFSSIASGMTRNDVANELNRDKILPPMVYMKMTYSKGKKYYDDWSSATIYRILKNNTYTGDLVVRKSVSNNYKQKKRTYIAIRDREIKSNTHPAIISKELFKEANSKLKTMKRREKNNYDGTFSQLVICGECGRIMTACRKNKNNKIVYYFECTKVENRKKCPNRSIYDSKLKVIIQDVLKELIDTFVDEDTIINTVNKELIYKDRLNQKISSLEKSIAVNENNIRSLYLKKTNGEISLDKFLELKEKENKEKVKKQQELRMIIENKSVEKRKNKVIDDYKQLINGDVLLKDYIKDIIEKIIIHKDNTIQIYFKFGVAKTKTIKLY